MKKQILIIASVFFVITILTLAQAGVLSNLLSSIKDKISSEDKQTLKDIIGKENLPDAEITYSLTDDEVKWGAYVPNVMNSQDNILKRYWMNCTLTNETTGDCETEVRINYTKQESADMISEMVAKRLSNYAQARTNKTEFGLEEIEIVPLE